MLVAEPPIVADVAVRCQLVDRAQESIPRNLAIVERAGTASEYTQIAVLPAAGRCLPPRGGHAAVSVGGHVDADGPLDANRYSPSLPRRSAAIYGGNTAQYFTGGRAPSKVPSTAHVTPALSVVWLKLAAEMSVC